MAYQVKHIQRPVGNMLCVNAPLVGLELNTFKNR